MGFVRYWFCALSLLLMKPEDPTEVFHFHTGHSVQVNSFHFTAGRTAGLTAEALEPVWARAACDICKFTVLFEYKTWDSWEKVKMCYVNRNVHNTKLLTIWMIQTVKQEESSSSLRVIYEPVAHLGPQVCQWETDTFAISSDPYPSLKLLYNVVHSLSYKSRTVCAPLTLFYMHFLLAPILYWEHTEEHLKWLWKVCTGGF